MLEYAGYREECTSPHPPLQPFRPSIRYPRPTDLEVIRMASQAKFVGDKPKFSPGRCLVSGIGRELIDLGKRAKDVGPRHELYVSVEALKDALEDAGYVRWADVEERVKSAEEQLDDVVELREKAELYDRLVGELKEHIEPDVVEREVVREVVREVSDEDVKRYLARNPDAMRSIKGLEPGSDEKYFQVYGPSVGAGISTGDERRRAAEEKAKRSAAGERKVSRQEDAGGEEGSEDTGPPSVFSVHGQNVNIDQLLTNAVGDIVKYLEGHSGEFKKAVAEREVYLRRSQGDKPRSTLLAQLGFKAKEEEEGEEEEGESGEQKQENEQQENEEATA